MDELKRLVRQQLDGWDAWMDTDSWEGPEYDQPGGKRRRASPLLGRARGLAAPGSELQERPANSSRSFLLPRSRLSVFGYQGGGHQRDGLPEVPVIAARGPPEASAARRPRR